MRKEMERLIRYFKRIGWRRFAVMVAGNVFLGMGISIFKLSGMGTDPNSSMVMALADCAGIAYQHFLVLVNIGLFLVELAFGRYLIGAGTVVNACLLGYIVTFFYGLWEKLWGVPGGFGTKLVLVCIGVIIISLGVSMYQTADAGVAPWDSLSLIMTKRVPRISYFWHRIFTDVMAVTVALIAGGVVGIGTAVCALGLGPVVQFFDRIVSGRLAGKTGNEQ